MRSLLELYKLQFIELRVCAAKRTNATSHIYPFIQCFFYELVFTLRASNCGCVCSEWVVCNWTFVVISEGNMRGLLREFAFWFGFGWLVVLMVVLLVAGDSKGLS